MLVPWCLHHHPRMRAILLRLVIGCSSIQILLLLLLDHDATCPVAHIKLAFAQIAKFGVCGTSSGVARLRRSGDALLLCLSVR